MPSGPIAFLYDRCRPGARSFPRRLHRAWFTSSLTARLLFGVTVPPETPPGYRYDLTTVLLARFVARRLRSRPGMSILELGSGSVALPSGYLARRSKHPIDAVDHDAPRVASCRRVVEHNDLAVRVWQSDLFASVPRSIRYDLVYWNLPYHRRPDYLHRLFDEAPRHLSEGGELVLGYNGHVLARRQILEVLPEHGRLVPVEARTWRWNRHEILVLAGVSDPARVTTGRR